VDKDSVKFEIEPGKGSYRNGTVTFAAKKGKSIDLEKLHESIKATRLSGKTRSAVNYLEVTAQGEVVVGEVGPLLNVTGAAQQFALGEDPNAGPAGASITAYQRLRDALARGERVASVTGRVQGWSGPWPVVLRGLAGEFAKGTEGPDQGAGKRPPLLVVTDFQTVKE
jgi:hypothetical protein